MNSKTPRDKSPTPSAREKVWRYVVVDHASGSFLVHHMVLRGNKLVEVALP